MTASPLFTAAPRATAASSLSRLAFVSIYTPALLGACGLLLGGWWRLAAPLTIFVLVPLADLLGGHPPATAVPTAAVELTRRSVTWLPRVAVLLQPVLMLIGAWAVARAGTVTMLMVAVVTVGASGGVMGIASAHELIHRNRRLDMRLAELVLATVCHMHWTIEHLGGHHRTIGLPGDPGTALFGESLYGYWWRYLTSSYAIAFRLEGERRRRRGLRRFGAGSRMFWFTLIPISLGVALGVAFGWLVSLYFFAQALLAFTLLASVNYVEHYGLQRGFDGAGKPRPIAVEHSWDTECVVSGFMLLNLQRHADHHVHPARGFDRLTFQRGPRLPTGYMGMFWLALVPALWRRVMDPAALAWRASADKADRADKAKHAEKETHDAIAGEDR